MAGGREIKTKIKSVQNTRKVTRALEMVSASKIRKAQDRMKASRPYARAMKQVIGHLAQANSEYQHPYLVQRAEVKRVGYIIVSSDRGLAGGLNNNLFRKLLVEIRKWQDQGVEVDVVTIGQKARVFFRRIKVEMLGIGHAPGRRAARRAADRRDQGDARRLQRRQRRQGVPGLQRLRQHDDPARDVRPAAAAAGVGRRSIASHDWDYIYEPDAPAVLEHVLTRYVESLVYQAVLENVASEHAARMVAMKAASDNATKLIGTLQLIYNKARQAAITQEISEIVGGAAAV